MFGHLVKLLRARRVYVLALGHLAVFLVTYWLAFALRFDFDIPARMRSLLLATVPWVLGVKLAVFYWTGCYHGWWRYVAFSDLFVLARAALVSALVIVALDRFVLASGPIPRTVFVLDLVITVLVLGGLRSSVRALRERFWPALTRDLLGRNERRRAVIAGTDHSGAGLARLIQAHPDLPYRIVGFLDADVSQRGCRLGGVPVLGTPGDLDRVARRHPVEAVLVVAGSLPGKCVRQLVDACARLGLTIRVLPPLGEFLSGNLAGPYLRKVDIEDLLHRDPVVLDSAAIAALIEGQTVLVTGAGGSIGCEICRQVLRFRPGTLVLVERAENNLFLIERELRALYPPAQLAACIADVRDRARMGEIFARHKPSLVFHAAAYKHVPMMEFNCGEAIKNNVFGTKRLADLAHACGVERFVLISTDKAVRPSSVMGVTKQIAEQYVQALARRSRTKFMIVRFGNVLGSAGSVVPIFQEQIRRGGPVTITHPDMTRYFMTIPEASQLVLQAAALGKGGEIYVLDMGEPVRIVDLAHDLIRLLGLTADDIDIVFTGPRPGEKLSEELHLLEERTLPSPHPKILIATPRPFSYARVRRSLARLRRSLGERDAVIRETMKQIIPEYQALPGPPPAVREDAAAVPMVGS